MSGKRINVAKYHGYTVDQLQHLHTGTLMNIRKAAYHGRACECCGEAYGVDAEYNNVQRQLLNNVLQVLQDRPHIPNKMERKAARQLAAKKGK